MITLAGIDELINDLKLLAFFPAGDEGFLNALTRAMAQFAEDDEQLEWLGQRMVTQYREWPGIYELRGVFCRRFRPKDGINAYASITDSTPGGSAPRPLAEAERRLLSAPETEMLPDGRKQEVIHNEWAKEIISELRRHMPRMRPLASHSQFARTLEEAITAPQDRPELPAPAQGIITQADIDAEVARRRGDRMEPK